MAAAIWNLHTTAMEWEGTMIKPEIKLIKMVEWKHANWLMAQIDQYKLCDKDTVPMVEVLDPETKKQLEVQIMCTTCGRSLTIYE